MKRNVSLEEISDGRLYGLNDMVKAGCGDCQGCSACCEDMGSSIILDPLDVYRLTTGLGQTFDELLLDKLELNVVDGVILPDLKMSGEQERCSFLDAEGRCSIHSLRPGICRIFPLGRYYENGGFRYFLQNRECRKENRSKVKVSKWIDTPELNKNQTYILTWHNFLKDAEEWIREQEDADFAKRLNLYLLNLFYRTSYDSQINFYEQFEQRMARMKETLLGE